MGSGVGAPPDLAKATTTDKEHGRLETRTIKVSAEVVPHLQWPGAAQVARIERTREIGDKTSVEVAYIVTSLPAAEAGPDDLRAGLVEVTCINLRSGRHPPVPPSRW